jgi:hypothetical protein
MHAKMKELKFEFKGKNVLLRDVEYMNFSNIHPEEQNEEEIVFQELEIDSEEIEDGDYSYVEEFYEIAIQEFLNVYYKGVKNAN